MTLSQRTFLSEISKREKIPEPKLAYLEQRAMNSFYNFVLKKFEDERTNSNLTKAQLAKIIGKGPDQVNRWLANPSNWTVGTIARLLAGISGEEPILNSMQLIGRPPTNTNWGSALDNGFDSEDVPADPSAKTSTTSPTKSFVLESA